MKQFMVFTKKEFKESLATYKLYILLAVFLIFGIISPLFAKILPDVLGSMEDTGIVIQITDPTVMDSWAQFFKNIGQMGMLVIAIIFSGIMSNEFSKGTLINLLTKGLTRKTVVLSKMFSASALWTISYLLSLGVCAAYTAYFWNLDGLHHVLLSFTALWLFGELLISLLMLGGTLFNNNFGGLLSCFAVVVILNLVGIIPNSAKYNPVSLAGGTLNLLSGAQEASDFIPAMIICTVLIIAIVITTILIFNKKRL